MSNDVVVATYLIESFYPLQDAAQILAGEQSSGTFVAVPGETRELRERHAARVIAVDELPPRPAPSLPGAARPTEHRGAAVNVGHVRIAFPVDNFGPSLPGLIPAVLGNLFELRELAGVRLLDLDLPEVFARRYPGPQFGVAGTRRLLDAPSGALSVPSSSQVWGSALSSCAQSCGNSSIAVSILSRTTSLWPIHPTRRCPTALQP
jgi:ribulose-bisphosphate carboxylase large chain